LNLSNPFETTPPTPEPGLLEKVRLIARVDLAFAAGAVIIWAMVGTEPATMWGAFAIVIALIGAMTFGAASLIGWVRLTPSEREKDWIAVTAGLVSFAIGFVLLAFYAVSVMIS
jgi:hypothetical protein